MKEYSRTFCIYPWIHQMTTPIGLVNFCCISFHTFVKNESGHALKLGRDTFQDAWNTRYMKEIRRRMLAGEEVPGCETCYEQEKIGKKSYRQSHTEEWSRKLGAPALEKIVEASAQADFHVHTPPAYLDLRLGNLCNLKCRMCNPTNSIQVEKEWLKLDQESAGEYSRFWKKQGIGLDPCDNWYESESFWASAEAYIPHLRKVYMTGGEPTLIEGNYRFLGKCRELGFASQIELFFNLNFTNMRDTLIEHMGAFQWTSVNASFDGFGIVNDYIRGNSRWEVCEKNFRKLAAAGKGNLGLGMSPVIQVYNVLDIVDLLEFAEQMIEETGRDILVDFLFCFHPTFLDIAILPASVKQEAVRRLGEFRESSYSYRKKTGRFSYLKNGVDSMVQRLEQTMHEENPQLIADFLSYTKTLDLRRNQNFPAVFPELHYLLKKSGYDYEQVPAIALPGGPQA